MAPELLEGGVCSPFPVDVFAFGMCVYEMLSLGTPFSCCTASGATPSDAINDAVFEGFPPTDLGGAPWPLDIPTAMVPLFL